MPQERDHEVPDSELMRLLPRSEWEKFQVFRENGKYVAESHSPAGHSPAGLSPVDSDSPMDSDSPAEGVGLCFKGVPPPKPLFFTLRVDGKHIYLCGHYPTHEIPA